MKTRNTHLLAAATLTAILLTTAACASPPNTEPNATPLSAPATTVEPSPSATASAMATATPTATVTPALPASEPAAAPAPESHQSPPMERFTFPDGHISFTHTAGWTVTVKPGPALNAEAQKNSFKAIIRDGSGTEMARVNSGMYGDGASGPAKRTILDHAPVPGITNMAGESTEFGFAYDELVDGNGYYFMDVRNAREFLATTESTGSNQIRLPNGILSAHVVLTDSPSTRAFSSPAAAKAWMETGRYAQLKSMLLSLKYA
ncbi:hypothetical protein AB4089_03585 [Arthrobacter sp. 2MCAF15]|uniref:hypothetical protein n=1 Tax=Arthrobacter sp. 2MCAF15 TaxID=3232984 RepID=UPI003F8F48C3